MSGMNLQEAHLKVIDDFSTDPYWGDMEGNSRKEQNE